jgi:hypothetical protein
VWVERIASEQPGLPFECKLTCDPCDLTIVEVNENAIAGTLRCDGLKTCTEPTLPSEALEGSLCGQLTTHLLDVSVDFRFTEPSAKRKDY